MREKSHRVVGLDLRVIWLDPDLAELRIHASNGRFEGTADVYVDHQVVPRLAATFAGFPTSPADERDLELGTFDPKVAGGGVQIQVRCSDRSGHVVLRLRFRTDPSMNGGRSETAEFDARTEAAAVDSFAGALGGMRLERGASVRLTLTDEADPEE